MPESVLSRYCDAEQVRCSLCHQQLSVGEETDTYKCSMMHKEFVSNVYN